MYDCVITVHQKEYARLKAIEKLAPHGVQMFGDLVHQLAIHMDANPNILHPISMEQLIKMASNAHFLGNAMVELGVMKRTDD